MDPSNDHVSQNAAGYGVAAAIAIILNTLLTWAKESYPPLLAAMKSLGHHWAIHGTIIVLTFFILGYLLSKRPFARRMSGLSLAGLVSIATVLGGIGLVGFFLLQ